jgi:hypothetical protein
MRFLVPECCAVLNDRVFSVFFWLAWQSPQTLINQRPKNISMKRFMQATK